MPRGIATCAGPVQPSVVATRPSSIVPPAVLRVGSPPIYFALTPADDGDFGPSPTPLIALTA
jgi:hypothetical protein